MPPREPASQPRRSTSGSDARRNPRGRQGGTEGRQGGSGGRRPPSNWGGVARRGADEVRREGGSASDEWRRAAGVEGEEPEEREPWAPEEWRDEGRVEDDVRRAAKGATRRGSRPGEGRGKGQSRPAQERAPRQQQGRRGGGAGGGASGDGSGGGAPVDDEASLSDEIRAAVGTQKAERTEERLKAAGKAFRRGRYEDARKALRPLAEAAPSSISIRELYGLSLYRLGRWRQALKELEAWRTLSKGSTDQHPVMADCHRALGQHARVEELWEELRTADAEPEIVAEGRIVAAGSLADRGRLADGIRLLQRASKPARRAKEHHIRMAYALGDLYERAGDLPKAREMFQRVAASEPDFVDVQARIRALD